MKNKIVYPKYCPVCGQKNTPHIYEECPPWCKDKKYDIQSGKTIVPLTTVVVHSCYSRIGEKHHVFKEALDNIDATTMPPKSEWSFSDSYIKKHGKDQ